MFSIRRKQKIIDSYISKYTEKAKLIDITVGMILSQKNREALTEHNNFFGTISAFSGNHFIITFVISCLNF